MKYPTLKAWYHHVNSLTTVDDVNDTLQELRKGEFNTRLAIHDFKASGDMGRAMKALINHAERLGFYSLGDGSWRIKMPEMIEHEAQRQAHQLQQS